MIGRLRTLAALRIAKTRGYLTQLAICNVPESSLVRESELVLMTRAGPEIGVASTKAFITQLTALALFALELGRHHGLEPARYANGVRQLEQLPGAVKAALTLNDTIKNLAERFGDKEHVQRRWLDVSADAVADAYAAFQRASGGPIG